MKMNYSKWLYLALFSPVVASYSALDGNASELQKLSFLSGCWQSSKDQKMVIRETFTTPQGNTILGNSQMEIDGERVFLEFIKIVEEEGKATYHPYPDGKYAKPFKVVKLDGNRVAFENLENDFPKIISYHQTEAGGLTATISGDDEKKTQIFEMYPIECGGESYKQALIKLNR